MSKKRVLLPLDSYRLAQCTVDLECYFCDSGNTVEAERCRNCLAPLTLSRSIQGQTIPPRLISTVGSPGAGKSVFLGMLSDLLSRQHDSLQLTPRGPFSVSLQEEVMAALAACHFPDRTQRDPEHWRWIHGEIRSARSRKATEIIMPDVAGKAISEEIEHPRAEPIVRGLLQKSNGLLLMIDADRLEQGDEAPDFFAMKVVSYLCELDGHRRRGWPNRPVAFVFTKADQNDSCFADPAQYARERTPGVWQQSRDRLRRCEFFAAGVAGKCAVEDDFGERVHVPLRIEPRGIVEPFAWLMQELR